jgi:hypothetical protein
MTFEKKCLIEVSDIVAVHYECSNCHSVSVVPIEKIDPERAMSMCMSFCSYCQTPFGFQPSSNEIRAFVTFNTAVKQIRDAMEGRNLKLKLEITNPE